MTSQEIASSVRRAEGLIREGKLREASELCERVIAGHPLNSPTLHLLGLIAFRTGEKQKATDLLLRAVRLSPDEARYHNSLGIALGASGKPQIAVRAFARAVELKADFAEAHANLGTALAQQRKFPEAQTSLRRAIELNPKYAEAHCNLGNVLRSQGKLAEAMAEYDEAVRINPNFRETYAGQATVLWHFGDAQGAVAAYRRAVELMPNNAVMHSNLIYTMHYQPDISSEDLFAEHLKWARLHAEPLYRNIKPYSNDRDPDRRLRIGYISADFREHPRARFIDALLSRHDRDRFEIFCYNDATKPDHLTTRFRQMANAWRDIAGESDEETAELIREDGIDLLVDCTGHMAHNRMLLLARKPAPIQVLYPGYPNTSGLKTVDYWITDAYQDPPGLTERFHTEEIIRIEPFARCYGTSANSPDPGPLPAAANGFVTFGAMNNAIKNNHKVLSIWSQLLAAIPAARLLVLVSLGAEQAVRSKFARHGIPAERLEIVRRVKREEYLALFQKIDIALDTFPYNGYTTTLDSLWMGVPVLALAGDTNVSRAGVSLLSNVGLPEWIASSLQDYLERAVRFASDIPALAEMRSTLRQRMETSPLMDAAGFIGKLESAYRTMWKRWCRA